MQGEIRRSDLSQAQTPTLNDEAYELPTTTKETGETMSMQTRAAVHETARDMLVVSAFGFWATILGFVPVVAVHAVFG
jgi:hypothetical protein